MTMVGVDIGGTFTDFVIVDGDGTVRIHKRPSTPSDPAEAFVNGLDEASVGVAQLVKAVHGTTVGTNTMIERKGARTGLITTEGFRDVLEIGRGVKPPTEYFNLRWDKPEALVPRELRCEVRERITADGSVVEPLDEADALAALEYLVGQGCDSVAICLLFSYANGQHEQRIAELASEHHPQLHVSTSIDILPQWREYERTSTTVGDAYIKPVMARYFGRLERELAQNGLSRDLLIMKSNGGLMTARTGSSSPIHTFLSGPAAAALAGKFIGQSAGFDNVITADMGGTSFDVSLVRNRELTYRMEGEIDAGIPVLIPMIDIRTIGAGGGSIGWIDAGGALKVGPRSAGAVPGPACYGRGGTLPTVTDANVVLGRVGGSALLAGALRLDAERSVAAVEQELAGPLGLDVPTVARGIVEICVHNMVHEVQAISAQQGFDPRDCALVAAGGAGPLHAALIAEVLGMQTVIVPPRPGLLSATGLLLADLRFDVVRSWPFLLERSDVTELAGMLDAMARDAVEVIRGEGFEGEIQVLRTLDMRYHGQNWEIGVPVTEEHPSIEGLVTAFDDEHERLYGVRVPGARHEVVNLRVSVIGPQHDPERWLPRIDAHAGEADLGTRQVYYGRAEAFVEARVLSRDGLAPGDELSGTAVVEQTDTTIFVPGGWSGRIDDVGNLVLTLDAAEG